ncbi:CidA/LrgA family protein [Chromobacterium piscinae]|uniref:CidA/LrgA family protein n=1 Tax=Chromobacterium piscinae TaxID=686831 RepID=A0ABV0H883_9NEIS|nr:CidA/LrgA family protein [Chromobacterium piscinae]MBX9297688.1 CidA/LrgA family protein [Chromobacterium vaccinii]MBX9357656.1 CidA/LrgA family protein [Chromobacterium vaccinii]MCD4504980.1 CidA/LrgA family protein [Chromobacterium piscinae]MCD5327626.1 CidA/LrgA family protein [Chromobacterium piscinae]
MARLFHRLSQPLQTFSQVLLLSLVWMAANQLSHRFLPVMPAGVLGMLLVLAGLWSGLLPVDWLRQGARWLLAEMLLFFIPAVVAVVQYPDVILSAGVRLLLVIVASTALVMAVTALVVDRCYRLEIRLRRRDSNRKAQMRAEVHGA